MKKHGQELFNLRVLRSNNRLNLKNIFRGLFKGAYAANYYSEMSIVNVLVEIDRLKMSTKGKFWEVLDQQNLNYIENMSKNMIEMGIKEFRVKVLIRFLVQKKLEKNNLAIEKMKRNSINLRKSIKRSES